MEVHIVPGYQFTIFALPLPPCRHWGFSRFTPDPRAPKFHSPLTNPGLVNEGLKIRP